MFGISRLAVVTLLYLEQVGNKLKGWISKHVLLENKANQIFKETNIS